MEKSDNSPFCSVIVLNFNGMQHLDACLASLQRQTYKNYEIILADNGSTDESIVFVKKNYPEVKILINSKNDGTAGGFNFGAAHAQGEYLLFLANDLEAKVDLIAELIRGIEKDPAIAICSGKMLKYDQRDIIDYNGLKIDMFAFPYCPGHNEKDLGQGDNLSDVVPTGTVLLIKNKVFQAVGGFDSAYFTLGDEIDLWWRVRLLGYRAVINHKAIVYHKGAATLSKLKRARLRFYSEKNTIRTLLKNYSLLTQVILMPVYCLMLCLEIIFYLFVGRWSLSWAVLKAIAWNLRNIINTIQLRIKVQKARVISDRELGHEMVFGSMKLVIFGQWLRGEAKL